MACCIIIKLADEALKFNRFCVAGAHAPCYIICQNASYEGLMHLVTIEKAADYQPDTVKAALVRLLAPLGGMRAFVNPGERVLIKPNLLAGKSPEKAVTTHPEVLRAVIELGRAAGGAPLVGDSPGIGGLRKVAEKAGILAVIEDTGAELVEFTEPVPVAGAGMFKRALSWPAHIWRRTG
jgi:uncharacterized protein (DUF362 family)